MKLQVAFLRSRLGRRILVLFFFCALLPSAAVAFLAFNEVSRQFDIQSRNRIRQTSKALGLAVNQQLLLLESDLAARGAGRAPTLPSVSVAWLEHRFEAVAFVEPGGLPIPILGTLSSVPPLRKEQLDHLRSGGTTIAIEVEEDTPNVYLARASSPGKPETGIVFWRVRPDYLWSAFEAYGLGPGSEICIVDEAGRFLQCSDREPPVYPEEAKTQMRDSASGFFEWETDRTSVLAGYWTIFLRGHFAAPKWTTVVSLERRHELRPIENFKRTFPLVIAGTLCLVLLLSINQIRQSLGPLEALQEGTARIARGDFDTRVRVRSRDEFQELAESFNGMAARLGRQFRTLATMSEIGQAVLSVIDRDRIVQTLLHRIPELYPCDSISVALPDPDVKTVYETWVRSADGPSGARKERGSLTEADLQELHAQPESLLYSASDDLPDYLRPLCDEGAGACIVLPIVVKSELLGILSLGQSAEIPTATDALLHVRRLADQVGVALSNVRMFDQVRFLAYYDALTGLPNRVLFQERIRLALARSARDGKPFAVFLLDLDNFKRINDTLGHATGDELLRAVAGRIMECLRQNDTLTRWSEAAEEPDVARLGGDEFTILVTGIDAPQDAARVASRVLATFERGFLLGTREVFVTPSLGIAVAPLDGDDADTLLKNADTAMYHAKEEGRNNFQFYRESMSAVALHRLTLESRLRGALERDEFVVLYQPVVELEKGRIVGVEALLRWTDPESGAISPKDFIPIAEETSLIIPIGEWVLRQACAQTRQWEQDGLRPIRIAVNVSARQFVDRSLVARVYQALRESLLDPSRLVLELTESILMESARERDVLEELKAIGLRISIDDFGTGYSSLGYLTQFPLDSLKIDRSFVHGIDQNPDGVAIISAIVAMARSLGLRVVAEGVETAEELAVVRQQGCQEIQGYLFSMPVPGEEITELLREDRRLPL